MGRIFSVFSAIFLALALLAAIVFGLGNDATVIPPPESVAEGLVRQLAARRFSQTRQFLSRDARNDYPPDRLRDWLHALETQVGEVSMVSGEHGDISSTGANATIHVRGQSGDATLQIELGREHGVWVVLELPPI